MFVSILNDGNSTIQGYAIEFYVILAQIYFKTDRDGIKGFLDFLQDPKKYIFESNLSSFQKKIVI